MFDILSSVPNQEGVSKEDVWIENQEIATKLIYKIIKDMFEVSDEIVLWEKSIEHGLITKILDRLQILTGEKPRRYV